MKTDKAYIVGELMDLLGQVEVYISKAELEPGNTVILDGDGLDRTHWEQMNTLQLFKHFAGELSRKLDINIDFSYLDETERSTYYSIEIHRSNYLTIYVRFFDPGLATDTPKRWTDDCAGVCTVDTMCTTSYSVPYADPDFSLEWILDKIKKSSVTAGIRAY